MKPLRWNNSQAIEYVETVLRSGGVVLAAGDTVLGLLADISESGYKHLDAIKNRSQKPYLILVGDRQKAFNLIEKDSVKIFQIEKLISACWPGPVTIIFKAKATVLQGVKSPEGNVAIRIPDHAGLLALLQKFDGLFSTSANSSGQPVPATLEQVDEGILNSVACVIINEDQSASTLASTIIDCTGEKIVVVREGAFSVEKLAEFLG